MFGKAKLAPMESKHVGLALEIIKEHDEDDFEWAQETYSTDLNNQFVYRKGATVYGVTGYTFSDDVAHISWTYVAKEHQRQGHGEAMLDELLQKLSKGGFRKVYVSTSDYRESAYDPMLYADAIALYKKKGFEQEAYHPNYFAKEEGEMMFGLRLKPHSGNYNHPPRRDLSGVGVDDVFHISETDASYGIGWSDENAGELNSTDLKAACQRAQSEGAESVFISFPSTYNAVVYSILTETGFKEEATLKDYWEDGVDDIRFRYNFN